MDDLGFFEHLLYMFSQKLGSYFGLIDFFGGHTFYVLDFFWSCFLCARFFAHKKMSCSIFLREKFSCSIFYDRKIYVLEKLWLCFVPETHFHSTPLNV